MHKEDKKIDINFDAPTHTYKDDTGQVYTSVTTLIGKYKPPFNQKYWSMYVALRDSGFSVRPTNNHKHIIVNGEHRELNSLYENPINGYEVEQVIKKWVKLTEDACARGNEIHDFLEDNVNESKGDATGETNLLISPRYAGQDDVVAIKTVHELDQTLIHERFPDIYKVLLNYIKMGCTLYAEKRVYSSFYLLAGMIDVLIVKGKYFAILDWKTNKDELLFGSGYYKKQKVNGKYIKTNNFIPTDDCLLYPLDYVPDCKGMVYSLQLSLYAFIMIMWGYKLIPKGLGIFHIRKGYKPKYVPIKFLKTEIELMLNHHHQVNILKTPQVSKASGINFGIR